MSPPLELENLRIIIEMFVIWLTLNSVPKVMVVAVVNDSAQAYTWAF